MAQETSNSPRKKVGVKQDANSFKKWLTKVARENRLLKLVQESVQGRLPEFCSEFATRGKDLAWQQQAQTEIERLRKRQERIARRSLSLLSEERVWLFTLKKSGSTFTLNVLVNYCVALRQKDRGTALTYMSAPLMLPGEQALQPNVLAAFHTFEKKIYGSSFFRSLELQLQLVEPALGFRGIIHTHVPVPHRKFKKTICLTRNPFDFAVSSYHYYYVARGKTVSFSGALMPILRDFAQHHRDMMSVVGASADHGLVVYYENLKRNPQQQFSQILRFLGHEPVPELLGISISRSSVESVHAMEAALGRTLVTSKVSRASFIRSGAIGEWRQWFSNEEVARSRAFLESQGVDLDMFIFD